MKIEIKTPDAISKMRVAGKKASELLDFISEYVVPGVSTEALNELCHNYMVDKLKCIPAPLGYRGFPKSICTSVNEEVCHGIPGPRILLGGDIVNIDVTVIHEEYHGDTSRMFLVGETSLEAKRLSAVTKRCLLDTISQIGPDKPFNEIGNIIEDGASIFGYSVVREYGGHGIGKIFHDNPPVLHYRQNQPNLMMKSGMTFTIEPMINAGLADIELLPDGWTVLTKDRSLSAQWEHTVLITDHGCEILTK